MLGVSLWACQRARRLAESIRDERVEGIDSRLIESYAVPTAALAVVHGMDQDAGHTRGLLGEMLEEAAAGDPPQPQHDDLMLEILSSNVQIGGERPTVAQCIERVEEKGMGATEAQIALAGAGIKICRLGTGTGGGKSLMIQYKPCQKRLLRGTRWEGAAIDQILRTLSGIALANRRVGGVGGRGIEIPWDVLEERYFGEDAEDGQKDMSF